MSFFDINHNPFMQMFEQMSQSEKDQYKKMGNYMYGIVDFETGKLVESEQTQELADVLEALRSGLSITDLTDYERQLIDTHQGCLDNIIINNS